MRQQLLILCLGVLALAACDKSATPASTPPEAEQPQAEAPAANDEGDAPTLSAGQCDETQTAISQQADERAGDYGVLPHLEKNFSDMKASWLMPEAIYQKYVVDTGAEYFGRCNDAGCFQFVAPTSVIQAAVDSARTEDGHDAAKLGEALGLPAENMEGPLRMMTLDLAATETCVRLPVDEDPGVWKCESEADTDCFKFGGYTSGGLPELMAIDAPVAETDVQTID